MAINKNDLTQATRGALFVADENTALPSNIGDFILGAETVGQWANIGHTSNDTKPSFSTSGGTATNLDTWLEANVATTYATTTGTLTINSVQGDPDTLRMVYNGVNFDNGIAFALEKEAQRKALFLVWQDSRGGRMGVYMPSVDLTYNSLPNFSGNGFVQFGISASILTSSILPATASGKPTALAIFSPEQFGHIVPVTGVTVTPATASVEAGATTNLTATVTPPNASQSLSWTSSNANIAKVNQSGVVTGVGVGTTTITAASITDLSQRGTATITVTNSSSH